MKGEREELRGDKSRLGIISSPPPPPPSQYSLQLFRERLSEKVHAAIPKGIVGGFECPVSQRNLKEWNERA